MIADSVTAESSGIDTVVRLSYPGGALFAPTELSGFLVCVSSEIALVITRADEFNSSAAKSVAIMMSGIPESNAQTPIAAKMTDRYDNEHDSIDP